MIAFIVVALPRSGTAWLANLLTTETTVCMHESFLQFSLQELDAMPETVGIAETSAAFFPEAINQHPAKKLIVTRPIEEINASADRLGLSQLTSHAESLLNQIDGYTIAYQDLFDYDKMNDAYKFLFDKQLNAMRHALLCNFHIENKTAISQVRSMF